MRKWGMVFGTLIILGWLAQSCGFFQPQIKLWHPDGSFSLEAPSYLVAHNKVSPGASLQLRNLNEDLFFVLRTSAKDSLKSKFSEAEIGDFYALHLDNLTEKLENPFSTVPDTIETPYLSGISGSIQGTYKGNLLQHQLVLLEDSTTFYQILYWMPAKHWDKYEEDLEKSVQSLRPMNASNMP